MKFIIVLVTVFSACCCFSVLNLILFEEVGRKSNLLYLARGTQQRNNLTDEEEILRCQSFTNKVVENLNQRFTQEELQAILSECVLLLQRNSKLSARKEDNNFNKLQPLKNDRRQEYEFITEVQSAAESSEEISRKYTGSSGNSSSTFATKKNEGNSTEKSISDKPGNQKLEFDSVTLSPANTSWSKRNFRIGVIGSSDNSSVILVKEQNVDNSAENFISDKFENEKTEYDNVSLSPRNKRWNLWSLLFDVSDSTDSSNENRSIENIERHQITDSDIDFENSKDLEYPLTGTVSVWNIIMPGTKWCGSGSIATNDDDLGFFENVDRCCRAHDNCDDIMIPGESKYNLTNTSKFTALNCKCDDELYDCLSQIDSLAANTVGNTFFNIFGRKCYTLDYPRICKKHALLGCLEYEIDKTAEKIYQWKPAKKYLKMPFTISG